MNKKTLVAGPWVGEFGWELFAWQAYIRALSRQFGKTIVISRENSKALYEDFCDEFVAYNPPNNQADSFFMYDLDINLALKDTIRSNKVVLNKNTSIIIPKRIGNPPHTHFDEEISFGKYTVKPEYIRFGKEANDKYDYVFHIRNRELRKEDNWPNNNWHELLRMLDYPKVACVGTFRESGHIEGTDDLRGISLSDTFDVLRNTKCIFGPSSGPIHLSSLCGCPHVVWGDQSKSLNRHYTNWNPLGTKVLFLDRFLYHPPPVYVFDKFKKWDLE